ncbi:hypothetical protein ACOMHN_031095 [Nucella lapillus]
MDFSILVTLGLRIIFLVFSNLGQNFCQASPDSQRHVYIGAIPFKHMRLDAPVLTSLENTSRRQCGLKCLQEPRCESFNYHVTNRTCELLSDYRCSARSASERHDLVIARDFRYYDCERDADVQNITSARANKYCYSEAACSPKCSCVSVGFSSSVNKYLTPDPPPEDSAILLKDSQVACFLACLALPLPLCRSVNTNQTPEGTQCQLLPFLASQRPASRFNVSSTWYHHSRKCFAP